MLELILNQQSMKIEEQRRGIGGFKFGSSVRDCQILIQQ